LKTKGVRRLVLTSAAVASLSVVGAGFGQSGRVLHVDGALQHACASYSVESRNCSGRDGPAYPSIQTAADVVVPGDLVRIRGGVFQMPARGQNVLSRSGTATEPIIFEGSPGETVVIRGVGFEDRDLDGDGDADGPADAGDRSALIRITGHHIQVRRVEVEQAPHRGVQITGDHNLVEEVRVSHSWGASILISGNRNTVRYAEVRGSRHEGGVGMLPGASGSASDNQIIRVLSYENGRGADGAKVLSIDGDPGGGSNSDGIGTSKFCADGLPVIVCRRQRFVENITWRNADDGFDLTIADSHVIGNVAIDNGPEGRRGFKVFRNGPGNRFSGNVAKGAGAQYRGFEARGEDTLDVFHNLGVGNLDKAIYADTDGTARGRYFNNVGLHSAGNLDFLFFGGETADNWSGRAQGDPLLTDGSLPINLNLPVGTVQQRWRFVMDQVVAVLTPRAGSPLIDAGQLVPGYHCATADDDPRSPMDPDVFCRHWAGSAPDIGPFEYGLAAPREVVPPPPPPPPRPPRVVPLPPPPPR
jgi:hypothetical protein